MPLPLKETAVTFSKANRIKKYEFLPFPNITADYHVNTNTEIVLQSVEDMWANVVGLLRLSGLFKTFHTGSFGREAHGEMTVVAPDRIFSGETFTISDGVHAPFVFEFRHAGAGTHDADVDISASVTADDVMRQVVTVIENARIATSLNIKAVASGSINGTPAGDTLFLQNTIAPGTIAVARAQNVDITDTVHDEGFTYFGMKGALSTKATGRINVPAAASILEGETLVIPGAGVNPDITHVFTYGTPTGNQIGLTVGWTDVQVSTAIRSAINAHTGTTGITASDSPVKAAGFITALPKAYLTDGDTFTLVDQSGTKVFEFDLNGGGVSGSNVQIDLSGISNVEDMPAVRAAIIAAINGQSMNTKASSKGFGNKVILQNNVAGVIGNRVITSGIAEPNSARFVKTNLTGGTQSIDLQQANFGLAFNEAVTESVASALFSVSGMSGGMNGGWDVSDGHCAFNGYDVFLTDIPRVTPPGSGSVEFMKVRVVEERLTLESDPDVVKINLPGVVQLLSGPNQYKWTASIVIESVDGLAHDLTGKEVKYSEAVLCQFAAADDSVFIPTSEVPVRLRKFGLFVEPIDFSQVVLKVGSTMTGKLTVNQASTNQDAIAANGNGTGAGITATGGSSAGSSGVVAIGAGPTGAGVTATGSGTTAGIITTGGATNGSGISAVGGGTNGAGVVSTGQGTGDGVNSFGGTAGNGVSGTGFGTKAGVLGTAGSGATGPGVKGVGSATAGSNGVVGVGTAASSVGVVGTGGANGPGATFTGGTGNSTGMTATGIGTGAAIVATGGATNGSGITAVGAFGANGIGADGGGTGTAPGVRGKGSPTGTGPGVLGDNTLQAGGKGVHGKTADGKGVYGEATSSGNAIEGLAGSGGAGIKVTRTDDNGTLSALVDGVQSGTGDMIRMTSSFGEVFRVTEAGKVLISDNGTAVTPRASIDVNTSNPAIRVQDRTSVVGTPGGTPARVEIGANGVALNQADFKIDNNQTNAKLAISRNRPAARSGSAATISAVASGLVTLTGLSSLTAQHVNGLMTLTGFATSANNGVFEVDTFISATSVKVRNADGVFPDANSGAGGVAWSIDGGMKEMVAVAQSKDEVTFLGDTNNVLNKRAAATAFARARTLELSGEARTQVLFGAMLRTRSKGTPTSADHANGWIGLDSGALMKRDGTLLMVNAFEQQVFTAGANMSALSEGTDMTSVKSFTANPFTVWYAYAMHKVGQYSDGSGGWLVNLGFSSSAPNKDGTHSGTIDSGHAYAGYSNADTIFVGSFVTGKSVTNAKEEALFGASRAIALGNGVRQVWFSDWYDGATKPWVLEQLSQTPSSSTSPARVITNSFKAVAGLPRTARKFQYNSTWKLRNKADSALDITMYARAHQNDSDPNLPGNTVLLAGHPELGSRMILAQGQAGRGFKFLLSVYGVGDVTEANRDNHRVYGYSSGSGAGEMFSCTNAQHVFMGFSGSDSKEPMAVDLYVENREETDSSLASGQSFTAIGTGVQEEHHTGGSPNEVFTDYVADFITHLQSYVEDVNDVRIYNAIR